MHAMDPRPSIAAAGNRCARLLLRRHARRRWLWGGQGGVAVEAAEEGGACQAAAGDLLFLKGHAAPGNYGMGAVHRSPDLDLDPGHLCSVPGADERERGHGTGLGRVPANNVGAGANSQPLRLLLTVDDVVGWAGSDGCGCGSAHGHAAMGTDADGEKAGTGGGRLSLGGGPGLEEVVGRGAHRADATLVAHRHRR